MNIIEQLKQAKTEQKITFDELSKKSGVPVSTIYDIFRGVTAHPRIDTLIALQKALNIGNTETPTTSSENIILDLVPTSKYNLLTPQERQFLSDTVNNIVDLILLER